VTKSKKQPFHQTLLSDFKSLCDTLASFAQQSKDNRKKLEKARANLEAAAHDLIDIAKKQDVFDQEDWLRCAATSLTPALVQAFGPAPANSISVKAGAFPWEMIAKSASPEHLEAMTASGLHMQAAHTELLLRALTARGADLQPFLEAHIETVWGKTFSLNNVPVDVLAKHKDFMTRYLTAAKEHHHESLQWWLEIAMRTLDGRDTLILHCLGVAPRKGHFIPDLMEDFSDKQSAHFKVQIEQWKRDIPSLLGNTKVLSWAMNNLVRA
jgi:ElaB/YqjD/DUF883 family membrane-anchored ribosome-binding protein